MERELKLKSKYNDTNTLTWHEGTQLGSLQIGSPIHRVLYKDDDTIIKAVDPSGGPMIMIGTEVEEWNMKVKSILKTGEHNYYVVEYDLLSD